jgi:HPt (histidine-containing phosphotransfer) domain-containing protein
MDKAVASIDLAGALKRLDGDTDIYLVLVGVFLEDAPLQMEKLGRAIRDNDTGGAVSIAHTLKSGARTVGAMLLGELCAELERNMGRDDPEPAGDAFARLLAEYARVACQLSGNAVC